MTDKSILRQFDLPDDRYEMMNYGNGHINETYLVSGERQSFILQRINDYVFRDVDALMKNIDAVCSFRYEKLKSRGEDVSKCLLPIKTRDGGTYVENCGKYYRMYNFIGGTVALDMPESARHFGAGGRCFASFMKDLMSFDAEGLADVIPNFHNTAVRAEKFAAVLGRDEFSRCKEVESLVSFVLERKKAASVVTDAIGKGEIPVRVTHNDTKFNNLLFDAETHEPVAVIDLDTIMKGSILYDFGDAVRTGCATAAEDEHDLSKMNFALDYYVELEKAYKEVLGDLLTEREKELFAFSAMLMTYECGMRFLTDYLEGDVYFKVHYDGQNVYRAKTQFKLVSEMEKIFGKMTDYVRS